MKGTIRITIIGIACTGTAPSRKKKHNFFDLFSFIDFFNSTLKLKSHYFPAKKLP